MDELIDLLEERGVLVDPFTSGNFTIVSSMGVVGPRYSTGTYSGFTSKEQAESYLPFVKDFHGGVMSPRIAQIL